MTRDLSTYGGVTDPAIRAVSVLADDLRRSMYLFIRAAHCPVTRQEAAVWTGISSKLAAFHLEKLVDAGLLWANDHEVDGIRKVGRRPKVYEPTDVDISVTIPQRQHDLLADILLDAVIDEGGENAQQVAMRLASQRGEDLGARVREQIRPGRLGAERTLTMAEGILARHGFEPTREASGCLRLNNCPFHPLAAKAPAVVCKINHAFLAGLLTGLHASRVIAELRPRAGQCCVELRTVQRTEATPPAGP